MNVCELILCSVDQLYLLPSCLQCHHLFISMPLHFREKNEILTVTFHVVVAQEFNLDTHNEVHMAFGHRQLGQWQMGHKMTKVR